MKQNTIMISLTDGAISLPSENEKAADVVYILGGTHVETEGFKKQVNRRDRVLEMN